MVYNIAKLFEIAFGIRSISAYNVGDVGSLPQDVKHQYQGLNKESSNNNTFNYSGIEVVNQPHEASRLSHLGTPIILPITLKGKKYQVFDRMGNIVYRQYDDFELPSASLVTMRHAKIINKTKANAANGTVKEMYGFDDWKIEIRGFCLSDPSHQNAQTAYNQKLKLFEFDKIVDSISVISEVFNDLDISNIVIEELSFNQLKGKPGVIPFHMKCVSDEPLELIL